MSPRRKPLTRRKLLSALSFGLGSLAVGADATLYEPYALKINTLDHQQLGIGKKILHFSDLHYKGWNRKHCQQVIDTINSLQPELIFFTGDLIETLTQNENRKKKILREALELIEQLQAPCYGVIGNHDPLDEKSLQLFKNAFLKTGGYFLHDEIHEAEHFMLHGSSTPSSLPMQPKKMLPAEQSEEKPKILLCHYPAIGSLSPQQPYDLILCGHSHGGQVRLPFWGPLIIPEGCGELVRGSYETPCGNMYVNVGTGTFLIPIRFLCRPELAIIQS